METFNLTLPILVLIVLGSVFIAIAIFFGLGSERLEKRGRLANAVVTELAEEKSRDASGYVQTSYYPVFRYDDQAGSTHTVKSAVGTYPPQFKVGQSVRALYDPDSPSTAQIDTFGQMWMMPLILGIIGPILIVAGCVMWWKQIQ